MTANVLSEVGEWWNKLSSHPNPLPLLAVGVAIGGVLGHLLFRFFGSNRTPPGHANSSAGEAAFKQPADVDVAYAVRNDYSLLDGTCKMVLCVNMALQMGKVCQCCVQVLKLLLCC